MGRGWEGSRVLQRSDHRKRYGRLGLGQAAACQNVLEGTCLLIREKSLYPAAERLSYPAPISRTSKYTQAQMIEDRSGRASPYGLCLLHGTGVSAGDKQGSYGWDRSAATRAPGCVKPIPWPWPGHTSWMRA